MRKLNTKDVFSACRLLKKIGMKEQVQDIAQNSDSLQDAWSKGFDLVWGIFDKATEADGETALCEFLAGPFEMTAEEVAELHVDQLLENLQQLAAENNLASFFKSAARLMK